MNPEGDADYHDGLGNALDDNGESEAAIAAYREAICLNSEGDRTPTTISNWALR